MSSGATSAARVAYCTKCGKSLDSGARFCAGCGAAVDLTAARDSPSAKTPAAGSSDIATLERLAREHPEDASYHNLLAVALHDDSLANCERDPKDGSLLFMSILQLRHAREQLTKALTLKTTDTQLRSSLDAALRNVNLMEQRKFVGSWFRGRLGAFLRRSRCRVLGSISTASLSHKQGLHRSSANWQAHRRRCTHRGSDGKGL